MPHNCKTEPCRTGSPRVYWFLAGPRELASSRLHGYTVHEYLKQCGWETEIIVRPLHLLPDFPIKIKTMQRLGAIMAGDVAIFQKLAGPITREAIRILSDRGVITVFVDCDFPPKWEEAKHASYVVCSSRYLAQQYKHSLRNEVAIITEPFEASAPPTKRDGPIRRLAWFGAMDMMKQVEIAAIKALLARHLPHIELEIITGNPKSGIRWNAGDAWKRIAACDAVVLTGTYLPTSSSKSPNRAVQAMALGVPVMAFPTPANRQLIRHGRNGFLCSADTDWISAVRSLNDSSVRNSIAKVAYRHVSRFFSLHIAGNQWEHFLREIGGGIADAEWGEELVRKLSIRWLQFEANRGMAAQLKMQTEIRHSYLKRSLTGLLRRCAD